MRVLRPGAGLQVSLSLYCWRLHHRRMCYKGGKELHTAAGRGVVHPGSWKDMIRGCQT